MTEKPFTKVYTRWPKETTSGRRTCYVVLPRTVWKVKTFYECGHIPLERPLRTGCRPVTNRCRNCIDSELNRSHVGARYGRGIGGRKLLEIILGKGKRKSVNRSGLPGTETRAVEPTPRFGVLNRSVGRSFVTFHTSVNFSCYQLLSERCTWPPPPPLPP